MAACPEPVQGTEPDLIGYRSRCDDSRSLRRITHVMAALLRFLLIAALGCVAVLAAMANGRAAASPPIVTIVRHGGLCLTPAGGMECRQVVRITDTTISSRGYVIRRLARRERAELLRAIARIRPAYLRAHPFRGMCPVAYDGQESIYRFRGFREPLASCAYDLGGLQAVRVTERLLAG